MTIRSPGPKEYRQLSPEEKKQLLANGNRVEDWSTFLVCDPFFPDLIRNTSFSGEIRIQGLRPERRNHDGRTLEVGICNSEIRDCRIGGQTVIRNLAYCANFNLGQGCILSDIQEIYTRPGAKFGCGIRNPGEEESSRRRISLINEAGDRGVPPFPGMTGADAFLWSRYREDSELMRRLEEITDRSFSGSDRGEIGENTFIQGCRSLIDLRIGSFCRIRGADVLEDLSIDSSGDEPTSIGFGTILRRGITGPGCSILDGAMAEDFVLASHVTLTKGLRLSHCFVGDNSTIACCEVSNSLIFPFHEQHHNNSFLIASLLMGQSNLAAGATVGSNHNSRSADNELHAGRGFWPGLNVSLKHPSRFASFTLIAKGSYPSELDIPLPFSLVNNNEHDGCLDIIPAFWWNYNMYALVRNSRKYAARDRRIQPRQHLEFDFLAPDTAAEIRSALELLDQWDPTGEADSLEAPRGLVERSRRRVRILKAAAARQAYREMLLYYIASTLLPGLEEKGAGLIAGLPGDTDTADSLEWINMGGQLVPERKVDLLRDEIRSGNLAGWQDIHRRCEKWDKTYPAEKIRDAWACFLLLEGNIPDAPGWQRLFTAAEQIQEQIAGEVYKSRNKDFLDPFRTVNFRNEAEKTAVLGTIEGNEFVRQIRKESDVMIRRFRSVRQLLK